MVARSTVLTRAATIWPTGSVPYSQVTIHRPDGYRQDCSGFLSLCWAIPPGQWGGENTESLVTEGWMSEIPVADLQPGDAVGMCGPETLGNAGHIQLFDGWTGAVGGGLVIWEQAGGTSGPTHRTIKRITPGYRAYRFRDIADAEPPQREDDDMSVKLIAPDQGWGKGGVYKLYPTDLGMALEPLAGELGVAVQLWGQEVHVTNALLLGRPIEDIRAEWKAMGGNGAAGPSLDQIRTVVDQELDEQSRAGADQD